MWRRELLYATSGQNAVSLQAERPAQRHRSVERFRRWLCRAISNITESAQPAAKKKHTSQNASRYLRNVANDVCDRTGGRLMHYACENIQRSRASHVGWPTWRSFPKRPLADSYLPWATSKLDCRSENRTPTEPHASIHPPRWINSGTFRSSPK